MEKKIRRSPFMVPAPNYTPEGRAPMKSPEELQVRVDGNIRILRVGETVGDKKIVNLNPFTVISTKSKKYVPITVQDFVKEEK